MLAFDNLEHALAPDGTIADNDLRTFINLCLATPHSLRLIATSRKQVEVDGQVRRARRCVDLTPLDESSAVALLRDLDPEEELGLCDAPNEVLQEAARRCSGIPFALQRIAGILAADERLTLPKLLRDTSLFNEQVVENLMEYQYQRVTADQRRALEALAVFNRTMPVAAVRYLLEPFFPNIDVAGCLRALVRSHLVAHRRGRDAYELHPLDQQYACSQIPDAVHGARDNYTKRACHHRIAEYYLQFARHCMVQLRTSGEVAALEAFEANLEPVQAALDWCIREQEYALVAELAEVVSRFLARHGFIEGSRTRLQQGLEAVQQLSGSRPQLHAELLLEYAGTHLDQFQWAEARRLATQSLELFAQLNDAAAKASGSARAHNILGLASREGLMLAGEALTEEQEIKLTAARRHFNLALEQCRSIGDERSMASVLNNQGIVEEVLGNNEAAIKYYEEVLELRHKHSDQRGIAEISTNLGALAQDQGRLDEAQSYYEKALQCEQDLENAFGVARVLFNMGEVAELKGDLRLAHRLAWVAEYFFARVRSPYQATASELLQKIAAKLNGDFDALPAQLQDTELPALVRWALGSSQHDESSVPIAT